MEHNDNYILLQSVSQLQKPSWPDAPLEAASDRFVHAYLKIKNYIKWSSENIANNRIHVKLNMNVCKPAISFK